MIRLAQPAPPWVLVRLDVPYPPGLCGLLGYRGRARHLGISGGRGRRRPRLWDGRGALRDADWRTWLVWAQHPAVAPALGPLAAAEWIILDRADATVHHAAPMSAAGLLGAQSGRAGSPDAELEDPTGSRGLMRAELAAWLDGYASARGLGAPGVTGGSR